MSANLKAEEADLKSVGTLPRNDVTQAADACAAVKHEHQPKTTEEEVPPKKRKTRRGKSKRRHPYKKTDSKNIKPEAPYNSNRFLIEDHGNLEEIDERLKSNDQFPPTRTRDSSFSVDSDGEFYSTPDDEEEFLIKDFDDQYESLQHERLNSMSKSELIEEYLLLMSKTEKLNKRFKSRDEENELIKEIERLKAENERLKRENELLKNKLSESCSSDSEDSETDSSESCSSSTNSSSMSRPSSPLTDFTQTNGHSPPKQTV